MVETRFLGRSEAMDGPALYWRVTAPNPWLGKPLQYDLPSRKAALTVHQILWLLIWKEAFKMKLKAALFGDG
jgi:hypothetical protein